MITIPGKIPVTIHPLFWLLAAYIGWASSGSFLGIALWGVVIFFSVLIHEYGHALTAIAFGQRARIDLILTGGLTQRTGPALKLWQEFLVILNGPLAGFLLYGIALWLSQNLNLEKRPIVDALLRMALFVNFYWTVINLLPIQPLDGGHLLRVILEMAMGLRGVKIALFISMLLAGGLTGLFFYANNLLAGSILFLLTFESYRAWRSSLQMTEQDQQTDLNELMQEAGEAFHREEFEEAKEKLEEVRLKTGRGSLYTNATLYLAHIMANENQEKKAVALLEPLKSQLPIEGRMLLFQLYYKVGQYEEALAVGTPLYQEMGTYDVALLNAYCHAQLGAAKSSVGWLQAAIREGLPDVKESLAKKEFDPIRNDPAFQKLSAT